MLGLALDLPSAALRSRLGGGPPPPPPSISVVRFNGDSITYLGGVGGFARDYAAYRGDKIVTVDAQNSRTVGGAAYNGDLADPGTPPGNTLLDHRADDLATGAQLVFTLIGANDLTTQSVATYKQRLVDWATPIRAAGVNVAWSPPTPYWAGATPPNGSESAFTARRATLLADCRNPAVWGQWADIFSPMGLHPDFEDEALKSTLYGDAVHLSQAGHDRFLATTKAVLDTVLDAARAGSTTMHDAAWPGSETNLATSTQIVRRFMVSGIAPAGLSLGASVAGGAAQIRLNGGSWGSSVGTGGGNGYRIYNGDVIDLRLTTSASSATAVSTDLTIGAETRALSFATVANVTPAAYVHGNVDAYTGGGASTHTYPARNFSQTGVAVIAVAAGTGATGVTVDGVAATKRFSQVGGYGAIVLEAWTVPIATTGAKDIAVGVGGAWPQSAISWGVVTDADPTPVQSDAGAPAEGDPHLTGDLTVPASGLALCFFGENGSATPASATGGARAVDEGGGTYQGNVIGIAAALRTTSGTAGWNFGYGPHPRGAVVFKAAGT